MNVTPLLTKKSCLKLLNPVYAAHPRIYHVSTPQLPASRLFASLSSGFQGNAGSSCSACGAPAPGEEDTGPMGAFGGPMGPGGPMGRMSGPVPMGVGNRMVESEPNKSGLDFLNLKDAQMKVD